MAGMPITDKDALMGVKLGPEQAREWDDPPLYGTDVFDLLPDPEWHVQFMVPKGEQVIVAADSNAGKTSLVFEWAWALALGERDWHGYTLSPSTGTVLYFVTEGVSQVQGQVRGMRRKYGDERPDLLVHVDDFSVKGEDPARWLEFIREHPLQLVVVDTLNRTAAGFEENSSTDMAQYLKYWSAFQQQHRAVHGWSPTLIITHHRSKGEGSVRGSSAIKASMDAVINLERVGDEEFTRVSCEKMKVAKAFKQWRFGLDWEEDGYGGYRNPYVGTVTEGMSVDIKMEDRQQNLEDQVYAAIWSQPGLTKTELYKALPFRTEDVKNQLDNDPRISMVKDGRATRYYPTEER